jgi:hypothetical protein
MGQDTSSHHPGLPAFGSWRQAVFDVWEMPLVNPVWTVMALNKFLSHPDVILFKDS